MKYTSNHNFKLPAPSDTIDVEVLNENFTNIDALIKTLESAKADKNSPSFTGAPTAPTASSSTNSTQIATTAFVHIVQNVGHALVYVFGRVAVLLRKERKHFINAFGEELMVDNAEKGLERACKETGAQEIGRASCRERV